MAALDQAVKGYALGSAIRERLNQRKLDELKREAISAATDEARQKEFTRAIPDERGMAYKEQEQKIMLPEAMVWDQMYKRGIEQGADPEKWAEFVDDRRKKQTTRYFTQALLAYNTNPNIAAKALMKAAANVNQPLFVQPDGEGGLMAFAADPETGQISEKPFKITEDYLYKLKKLYLDEWDFGKGAAEVEYKRAAADAQRANAAYTRAGKGKKNELKPRNFDWYKQQKFFEEQIVPDIAAGVYGKDPQKEFEENPALKGYLRRMQNEFIQVNMTAIDPVTGKYVDLPPSVGAEFGLGLLYRGAKGYSGPKVTISKAVGKDGKPLTFNGEPAYYVSIGDHGGYIMPASVVVKFKRMAEAARQGEAPPEKAKGAVPTDARGKPIPKQVQAINEANRNPIRNLLQGISGASFEGGLFKYGQ